MKGYFKKKNFSGGYLVNDIFVFLFQLVGVNGCSKYRVNKCMDPIIDLRRRLGIPDEVEYFPLYKLDDQAFVDYCK